MPFLAERKLPIPNKDLLSWTFDEPHYDVDKPVSRELLLQRPVFVITRTQLTHCPDLH